MPLYSPIPAMKAANPWRFIQSFQLPTRSRNTIRPLTNSLYDFLSCSYFAVYLADVDTTLNNRTMCQLYSWKPTNQNLTVYMCYC